MPRLISWKITSWTYENEDIYVQTLLSAYLFYSIIYTIKMHVQIPIGLHPMEVGEKVS